MRKRAFIAVLLTAGFLAAQQPTQQTAPPPGLSPAQAPGLPPAQTPIFQPAQQPASPGQPGDDFRISIQTRFVIAPVTVTDRNGEVVDNLNTTDFQLFDNKKLQKITEDQASHPISLVVAIEAGSEVRESFPKFPRSARC